MNNRTKSNNTLRKKLNLFLKQIPSGEEIKTNHVVMVLSKLNRNYSLSSARVTNLFKENVDIKFIKSGIWMKL